MNLKNVVILLLALACIVEFSVIYTQVISPSRPVRHLNIVAIGKLSDSMEQLLSTNETIGISPAVYGNIDIEDDLFGTYADSQVTPEVFSNADVVLMQGEEFCDNSLNSLKKYINNPSYQSGKHFGWKFIIIGNACSLSKESKLVGLEALLDSKDSELATLVSLTKGSSLQEKSLHSNFEIFSQGDPSFFGALNQEFNGKAFVYDNVPKGFVLAYFVDQKPSLKDGLNGNYQGIPAIVRIGYSTYFSFDPSITSKEGAFESVLFNSISH